ncbi:MAG: hypothetical protein MRECE_12c017 [Mycoplasmataceae bacterium CE_OT135]|nr:MAG: hypothetical protein MRECE_12c017 [Mycoplasmataceae bacterium CE_OT135]
MKKANTGKTKSQESQNWKELVALLEKDIDQLNKDRAKGKVKGLTAVNVVCSQKDMDRTNSFIRKIREKESKQNKHA